MQHPTITSASAESRTDSAQAVSTERSATLATERALKAPLGALRVLLEGARQGAGSTPTLPFIDRALEALISAESAAQDLVAWTAPRSLRITPATVGEIVESVSTTMSPALRSRCHLVVDNEDVALRTDARQLVEAFARSVQRCLVEAPTGELMIHAHADDEWATFSFIDAPSDTAVAHSQENGPAGLELGTEAAPALADMLLKRDVERVGGRLSIHETGGHRCCVAVVPLTLPGDAS